jgi:hypothetical protein
MTGRNHLDEEVELGGNVEVVRERPSGPVVAVRIPREILARLSDYASRRGTTVSEVIRQAAIRVVNEASTTGPFVVSVSGPRLEGPAIDQSPEPTRGGRVMTRDFESLVSADKISSRSG